MSIDREMTVLVVEDEDRLRDVLVRAIPDMGFVPLSARSGEEALRLMKSNDVDIAILDLNLPGMGGMELFEKLHADQPDLKVIIMTGFGDLDAAKQAIHLDVVDFLTKPCSLGDLEVALDRARRRIIDPDAPPRPEDVLGPREPTEPAEDPPLPSPEDAKPLKDVEREHILAALKRHEGNRQAVADELGISVRTLYYRLAEYQKQGLIDEDEL